MNIQTICLLNWAVSLAFLFTHKKMGSNWNVAVVKGSSTIENRTACRCEREWQRADIDRRINQEIYFRRK